MAAPHPKFAIPLKGRVSAKMLDEAWNVNRHETAPKGRKAIVIGGRATARYLKGYDKTWELWGLNAIRPFAVEWVLDRPWSRMFNLHLWEYLKRDWSDGLEKDIGWAHLHPKVPFYVCDPWAIGALPRQVIFPRRTLEKMPHGTYHAGSFDWLAAFAAHLKLVALDFHGVGLNMESGEPLSARACLEYWCGYAEGRGCKITFSPDSQPFAQYHLVKSDTVYGYDDVKLLEDQTGWQHTVPGERK